MRASLRYHAEAVLARKKAGDMGTLGGMDARSATFAGLSMLVMAVAHVLVPALPLTSSDPPDLRLILKLCHHLTTTGEAHQGYQIMVVVLAALEKHREHWLHDLAVAEGLIEIFVRISCGSRAWRSLPCR